MRKPPRAVVGVLLAALAGTGGLIGAAAIANSAGQPAGEPGLTAPPDPSAAATVTAPARVPDLRLAGAIFPENPARLEAFRSTSGFTPAGIREFSEFALFSLGESFEGLSWSKIDRVSQTAVVPGVEDPIRPNYVNFIYGTCEPLSETGCSPPLTVQVWPACERTLADYRLGPDDNTPLPHEAKTIRGVPAADFGDRLELYTGDVTVVIFGLSDVALRAAEELKPANELASTMKDGGLPDPVAGATDGKLSC